MCDERHPRDCTNWINNECKFADLCKFKHDSNKKIKNKTADMIKNDGDQSIVNTAEKTYSCHFCN